MTGRRAIALFAGILFGAGLAISCMVDPGRVDAFLDLAGHWDPTLVFVMGGALVPMIIAWHLRTQLAKPLAADDFHAPAMTPVTPKLVLGALIFGVGWGIAGLCPGPAIADLILIPGKATLFVVAMLAGFGLYRLFESPIPSVILGHDPERQEA